MTHHFEMFEKKEQGVEYSNLIWVDEGGLRDGLDGNWKGAKEQQ